MVLRLMEAGIQVEAQHHEVASGGQAEIDIKYETLTKQADQLMLYKYIVKNVAKTRNKTATIHAEAGISGHGSGMHVHQTPVERRKTPVLRRKRLCRPLPDSRILHRGAP